MMFNSSSFINTMQYYNRLFNTILSDMMSSKLVYLYYQKLSLHSTVLTYPGANNGLYYYLLNIMQHKAWFLVT